MIITLKVDDPLSQARTISNHIEALILNRKFDQANEKAKETEDLLLSIFNGKPNQEVIQFIHKYAMRLSEVQEYDKSLEKVAEAKKLQEEFQGVKSDLYGQLLMLETRVNKLKEIQLENDNKFKLGFGSKALILTTVLGAAMFGVYFMTRPKSK